MKISENICFLIFLYFQKVFLFIIDILINIIGIRIPSLDINLGLWSSTGFRFYFDLYIHNTVFHGYIYMLLLLLFEGQPHYKDY